MLRPVVVFLAVPACLAVQAPDSEDDRAILDAGRQNALALTAALPDFTCTQAIRRFQSPAGADSWRQTDQLVVELSYSGGRENYQLASVDDHPADRSYHAVAGAVSRGEFGSWLHSVFDPDSAADFQSQGRETVRERAAAVFSYNVEPGHSHYDLNYRVGPDRVEHATVGYHGRIYIDLAAKRVTRLEIEAYGIPQTFPLKRSWIVLEYDFAEIGGRRYLLPLYSETRLATAKLDYRNETGFHGYRKFEARSSIRFSEGSEEASQEPGNAGESSISPRFIGFGKELARLNDDLPVFPPPREPSAEERQAVLDDARRAAVGFLAALPAFVCTDIFRISTAVPGESWKSHGVLTGEMRHSKTGPEEFNAVKLDQAASSHRTEFEEAVRAAGGWNVVFGRLRNNILNPRSSAQFRWDHWTSLRGRQTQVYSFNVEAANLQYPMTAQNGDSLLPVSLTVAQHGFVFVDRDSHRVTRIYSEAVDIPPAVGLSSASTLLDFDFAEMAPGPGLIPLRAWLRVDSKSRATRYESQFRDCTMP